MAISSRNVILDTTTLGAATNTKGVRPYSTATAPCARSVSFNGRELRPTSREPAMAALMPPPLPGLGSTTTPPRGWVFLNAAAIIFMAPSAPPEPPILILSSSPAPAGARGGAAEQRRGEGRVTY